MSNESKESVLKKLRSLPDFARHFQQYMGVQALVTAALPIPLSYWSVIPIFEAQRNSFTIYVPLFCFLLMAFVFYIRHPIGRALFGRGFLARKMMLYILPIVFMILAAGSVYLYYETVAYEVLRLQKQNDGLDFAQALQTTSLEKIGPRGQLFFYYLGIFTFSVLAFLLMSVKEFIIETLDKDEQEIFQTTGEPEVSWNFTFSLWWGLLWRYFLCVLLASAAVAVAHIPDFVKWGEGLSIACTVLGGVGLITLSLFATKSVIRDWLGVRARAKYLLYDGILSIHNRKFTEARISFNTVIEENQDKWAVEQARIQKAHLDELPRDGGA